jgi:hypothetical protein
MKIPEAILERLDLSFEDDGVTPRTAKLKEIPKQCEYCQLEVTKQRIIYNHTKDGVKVKCTACNNYKNPKTGEFELSNITQLNHILTYNHKKT